jgi:hypothetical protein
MTSVVFCECDFFLLITHHLNIVLLPFYSHPLIAKLYSDQVVVLIRRAMESKDPAKIIVALEVFQDVFHNGE